MNFSNQQHPVSSEKTLSKKELQQLVEVDSPTIANVIELFDIITFVSVGLEEYKYIPPL